MKIKEVFETIKELNQIRKCISRKQYFGKLEGYDFRKIKSEDAEIYDMMIHQPQYFAVSEAEFLERFFLNKNKEEFLKRMILDHHLRSTIIFELTKHMRLENEKVCIW